MQTLQVQQTQFFELLDKQLDAYKTLLEQLGSNQDKFNTSLQEYLAKFQSLNCRLANQVKQEMQSQQFIQNIRRNDDLYSLSQNNIVVNIRQLQEKQYKYKLILAEPLETPLYRDRIFQIRVELKDKSGNVIKNANKVELIVALYSQEQTPKEIKVNNKGDAILKGHLSVPLLKGTGFFTRIQIREVSSHFQNGQIIIVVLPQFRQPIEPINPHDIQPMIIENIKVKAKKFSERHVPVYVDQKQ